MTEFNVILWDINRDELTTYDVLPYFRNEYKVTKKKDRPHTREEWKAFVRRWGMYRFWAKCEYEVLVSCWPPHRDPDKNKHIKIDAWQQIDSNLDVVVDILMKEYE